MCKRPANHLQCGLNAFQLPGFCGQKNMQDEYWVDCSRLSIYILAWGNLGVLMGEKFKIEKELSRLFTMPRG